MASVVVKHHPTGGPIDPSALLDGPTYDNDPHVVTGLENVPNIDTTKAVNIFYTSTSVPAIVATARTLANKLDDVVSPKDIGIKADGVTDDAVAFRAAIDALPAGGLLTVLAPFGKYWLNSTRNGAVFDFSSANATKQIAILGMGWSQGTDGDFSKPQGTVFIKGAALATTDDIWHHQPNGPLVRGGTRYRDFAVVNEVNPVGRHCFHFDGSASATAYMECAEVSNVFVDNMATGISLYSHALDGSQGMLASANIVRNFMIQMRFENLGDNNVIGHNTLGVHATDDARNYGIYFYNVSGATNTRIRDNYLFSFQGFIEDDGSVKSIIEGNECEQTIASAFGAAPFGIKLTGGKYKVSGATVEDNRISNNVVASTATPIVIATAENAAVYKNWINTATNYPHIVVQAAASGTKIGGANTSAVAGVTQPATLVSYTGSSGTVIESALGNILPFASAPGSNPATNYADVFPEATSKQLWILRPDGSFGLTINPLGSAVANKFVTFIDTNGVQTLAQPSVANLSDVAWTTYTPTFSSLTGAFATAGNAPVASGAFKQIGKTVFFTAKLVVGAAGVGTASGATILSLPVTAAHATGCYPTGRENQTSGSLLQGWQQSSTTAVQVTTNALTFASGNNTTIEVAGTYEAA